MTNPPPARCGFVISALNTTELTNMLKNANVKSNVPQKTNMPTNTLTSPSVQRSVERRSDLVERIWQGTDMLVHGRINEARNALQAKGESTSNKHVVRLAHSLQASSLHEAERRGPDGHQAIEDWPQSKVTAHRLAALMLSLPNATEAQNRIDHHRSVHKPQDVATLSRFNSEIAGVLARMPGAMMDEFPDRLRKRSENVLQNQLGLEVMDERNINITMAGARREAAVLRALHETMPDDWIVRQTNTAEDVRGTDLVIYNDEGRELRVDVKSRHGFDHEIEDLRARQAITHEQAERAMDTGFIYRRGETPNGESVFNCVFDADMMGNITNYEYDDPFSVYEFVERQFEEQGQTRLRKLGKHAIISQSSS